MGKRSRVVMLTRDMVATLRVQRARVATERLASGPGSGITTWCFRSRTGSRCTPLRPAHPRGRRARDAAAQPAAPARDDPPRARRPPKVVQERFGHANPMITMAIYSHVTPTLQREAIQGFDDLLWPDRAAPDEGQASSS